MEIKNKLIDLLILRIPKDETLLEVLLDVENGDFSDDVMANIYRILDPEIDKEVLP